jgi:crooked neck
MSGARHQSTTNAKAVKVKNRAPAPIQITAEQLVLEARDRAMAQQPAAPKHHIADAAELAEHRLR